MSQIKINAAKLLKFAIYKVMHAWMRMRIISFLRLNTYTFEDLHPMMWDVLYTLHALVAIPGRGVDVQ